MQSEEYSLNRSETYRRLRGCSLIPVQEILNHMLDMLNLSLQTSHLLFVYLSEVCLSTSKYIKIGNFFLKGRYGFSEFLFSICWYPARVTASINSTGGKGQEVRRGKTRGNNKFFDHSIRPCRPLSRGVMLSF